MASQAVFSCGGGSGDILKHGWIKGGASGDPSATDDAIAVIEDGGLSRGDGTQGLEGPDDGGIILSRGHFGQVSRVTMTDFHRKSPWG